MSSSLHTGMIVEIIIAILIFLISGIPLFISVHLLGGKTSILRAAIVLFLGGLVFGFLSELAIPLASLLAFVTLIWVYRELFRLKWWKAFVVWFLQFLVLYIIIVFFGLIGLGTIGLL